MAIKATLISGDGIGLEIVTVVRRVFDAVSAPIEWEECVAGSQAFIKGVTTGVPSETLASIERTRLVLKGPLETPIGYGGKSANVTLRKTFETYGNIRPVSELPGIATPFSGRNIDLVIVRENVEDVYAALEYHHTPNEVIALKLMTEMGCQKICRLAFEYARAEGFKTVHCATKANILKLTEGMLKRVFEDVAQDYPEIQAHHILVDNCAHQLVMKPEMFEVIVMTNMNGDILSDLCSGLVGGLGFAPSANLGEGIAMFEAVHGSAPDIAGQNKANPTAILLSSVMLLRHVGAFDKADLVEGALLYTLQEEKVLGTKEFGDQVVQNLGKSPQGWQPKKRSALQVPTKENVSPKVVQDVRCDQVDIFITIPMGADVMQMAHAIEAHIQELSCQLSSLSSRGLTVYPHAAVHTQIGDSLCATFTLNGVAITELFHHLNKKYTCTQMHQLFSYDGKPAFTAKHGEE